MNSILANEIFLGILVFTVAVNAMVLIILAARKMLVSTGDVTIEMNQDSDKSVVVQAGGKLLQTLAAQIYFYLLLVVVVEPAPNASVRC